MSGTIVNMCLEEQTSSTSTKENIPSHEVADSPVLQKMKPSVYINADFTSGAAAPVQWTGPINLEVSLENLHMYGIDIQSVKFYLFLVDFDQPNRRHACGVFRPKCHANSGIVCWSDDIITAAGHLPIDQVRNANRYKKTLRVSIREQTVKEAVSNFNKFASLADHADFMAGLSERQLMLPVSTSPFVRLMCVCLYKLLTPTPGDPAAVPTPSQSVQAMSEVFVYRPSCPKVEAVHPMEFVFNPNEKERCNGSFNLVVVLSRPLIANYDQLRGAKLVPTSTADGIELPPIDKKNIFVTDEQDRVNIDLRDCIAAAYPHLPQLTDRFQARVCLLGVSGNCDWESALSDDVIFVQQHPWQQQPSPPQPPPSKAERRQRNYNVEPEEDDFHAVWMAE